MGLRPGEQETWAGVKGRWKVKPGLPEPQMARHSESARPVESSFASRSEAYEKCPRIPAWREHWPTLWPEALHASSPAVGTGSAEGPPAPHCNRGTGSRG